MKEILWGKKLKQLVLRFLISKILFLKRLPQIRKKNYWTFIEFLLCARHCSKGLVCDGSCSPHSSPNFPTLKEKRGVAITVPGGEVVPKSTLLPTKYTAFCVPPAEGESTVRLLREKPGVSLPEMASVNWFEMCYNRVYSCESNLLFEVFKREKIVFIQLTMALNFLLFSLTSTAN